jgi:hypothetical protein
MRSRVGIGVLLLVAGVVGAKTYRVDDELPDGGMGKIAAALVRQTVQRCFGRLEPGDALVLPSMAPVGEVEVARPIRGVQVIGGHDGVIRFGGELEDVLFFGMKRVGVVTARGLARTSDGGGVSGTFFVNNTGPVHLTGDITDTYWISHSLDSIHFLPPGFYGDKNGFEYFSIDGTMNDCAMLYFRYNNEMDTSGIPSMHFKLNESGRNVKVLLLVEHNQHNNSPAVLIEDAVGMALAHGSTEGCGYGTGPVYELRNCQGVYLGQRRIYSNHRVGSEWYGKPMISLKVGGTGNILDNFEDIGNPSVLSMLCTDPAIRIWSSGFEDIVRITGASAGRWKVFYTPRVMIGEVDQWTEPPIVSHEVIFTYEGPADTVDLTDTSAQLPPDVTVPQPPRAPVCDIPAPPELLYKRAAGFGDAALRAGADPTGRHASDRAFARVLTSGRPLELPPGTFRLERPLDLRMIAARRPAEFSDRDLWVAGSGKKATRIVAPPGQAAFVTGGSLARRAVTGPVEPEECCFGQVFTDLTIEGGDHGLWLRDSFKPDIVCINVAFTDQTFAGVTIQSGGDHSEHEQNRFISCDFVNTGRFGVRMGGYSDKYLFYRCRFSGMSEGGLIATKIGHFHGGVYQSTFTDIGGPGVSITGGNDNYGYGPWIITVDSCTFTECGSASEPVIDFGYSRLSYFTHSTVTTRSKKVFGAFRGNFAVIESVTIDVDVDSVALWLGHQRFEKTCRNQGARLVDVVTNGGIELMDYDEYVTESYRITAPFNHSGPQWWLPDDPYAYKWPYLFYNVSHADGEPLVSFSDRSAFEYALISGERIIDLSRHSVHTRPRPATVSRPATPVSDRVWLFDPRGRRVGRRRMHHPLTGLANGIYLHRDATGRILAVRARVGRGEIGELRIEN